MYAQRVAMDKSQNYAQKVQEVVAADPFLDENNRVPIASFAAAQFERGVSKGKEDALKSIATKGGLWVFYDSKCNFCAPQVNTVKEVSKKYGFSTKFIAMDGNGIGGLLPEGSWVRESGQARMLNIKITPTTVFVSPPNNFFVISQGLMSQDGLAERLILAAQTNDMLPPEILAGVQQYQRGLLKTEDLKDGASDDPKSWIEKLKQRLQGRY
jgi:conjugal transfer pilus assembly protein TraF